MAFTPRTVRFAGTIEIQAPVSDVFELFSPEGERHWVPGWNPELLHPPGETWQRGLIFRTQEEKGPAIWVVTLLDRQAHDVEYHRVERDRYVARVAVNCASVAPQATVASVVYEFIGLTEAGNQEIDAMRDADYAEKMQRWRGWIDAHLNRRRSP